MQCRELTISETLSDPIVQAVMLADRVDVRELEALLRSVLVQILGRSNGPRLGRHTGGAALASPA